MYIGYQCYLDYNFWEPRAVLRRIYIQTLCHHPLSMTQQKSTFMGSERADEARGNERKIGEGGEEEIFLKKLSNQYS